MGDEIEAIGNDGIVDGFEVLEDFTAKYDTDNLPEVDAKALDAAWQKLYEEGLVKCDSEGKEHVDLKLHKGDVIYFETIDWSKDLAFRIMHDFKDKIKVLS